MNTTKTSTTSDGQVIGEGVEPAESNSYEERKQSRIDRYRERAEKARHESTARYEASRQAVEHIPLGQPILVGHHSERRHRAALRRADNNMRKSIEADAKAKHYEQRAEAAENNTAISSDDPAAVVKLREKLAELELFQATVKADNVKLRKAKLTVDMADLRERMAALGVSAWTINEVCQLARLCPYHCQPYCKIPSYVLSNNNANAKRVRDRIEQLQRESTAETKEEPNDVCTVIENVEENRLQLKFAGKPPEAVRSLLKQSGFRWSPYNSAWQRQLNGAARSAANYVIDRIRDLTRP